MKPPCHSGMYILTGTGTATNINNQHKLVVASDGDKRCKAREAGPGVALTRAHEHWSGIQKRRQSMAVPPRVSGLATSLQRSLTSSDSNIVTCG